MLSNGALARLLASIIATYCIAGTVSSALNESSTVPVDGQLTVFRPKDCPPCFDCNLPNFNCNQFAPCINSTGQCDCPPGFGGVDCRRPLCGSLAQDNKDRPPRGSAKNPCTCKNGWTGINCNVCKSNVVCDSFMPEKKDGFCYKGGLVQKQNFQMCNVTNEKILALTKEDTPQATFSCKASDKTCNFQFWVGGVESFYCGLTGCTAEQTIDRKRTETEYACKHIKCECIPGRALCGKDGAIDLADFFDQKIKGPASFSSVQTEGGSSEDGSAFSEPGMNDLISRMFGDESIFLNCTSGECVHKNQVPAGRQAPSKSLNTPVIAGVIAGCALFVVAAILLVWFFSRRDGRHRYGALRLSEDDDDEINKMMADHKPAALHFENVAYSLNGKQILSGVQGGVQPGELLAIMGASGAGKTTFLDILARKNKRGLSGGYFYVNGEKLDDEVFRSVIGFVDQDDTMLPTLTVHETILDSALLRLPRDMGRAAKEQRVEDVERQLGIYNIRNQIIGSEEGSGRGISGGEKRRVGIACELVTSPSILFLDEPTSGLDAFNAYNVVECLVDLVKTYNRTVVFTIHQPRSNIVALFDQLILLADGKTVYSGPFSSCQSYFDSIGYACPPGFNIADYLVDLTMHASVARSPMDDIIEAGQGQQTRSSSAMAIKSLASVSNFSGAQSPQGSPSADSHLRPRASRKTSVRLQQEQQLFTKKRGAESASPATTTRSDDEGAMPDPSREGSQAWVKLSKQSGTPPPLRSLDDTQHLLPDANEGSETALDGIVASYATSEVAMTVQEAIRNAVASSAERQSDGAIGSVHGDGSFGSSRVRGYRKMGLGGQLMILSKRTWRNLYRNPMLMLTHYAISMILAVLVGFLFYGLTDDIPGFQNRLGLFFFVLALFGFGTLTSLTVFGPERLLFVRERAKGYYYPISYFTAKVIFDIVPLRLIPPIILGAIVYPMTGLQPAWGAFFKFILFLVLFNLAAAAICLFIGILFKNSGVANLIGSLVMLFSLLFAGFLLNRETIPRAALWLQVLSIFHFAFEGLIVNEVKDLSLIDHQYGYDLELPGPVILSSFGFDVQALKVDCIGLAVFCAVFIVLGYTAMHFVLVERR